MKTTWKSKVFPILLCMVCASDNVQCETKGSLSVGETLESVADAALSDAVPDHKFSGVLLISVEGKSLVRKAYGYSEIEEILLNSL
ncbi:MAG: hypothetical protein L0287_11330 [Anaerolineae bacterium]|nr:hypothetical protein [Anaerolineae bacterium]